MKHWKAALTILMALSASFAVADDFKTINGKEYKDATVSRVEPDGIVLKNKSGISKVYFTELPKDVQQRFHYDSQQAAQFQASEENNRVRERKVEAEARERAESTGYKHVSLEYYSPEGLAAAAHKAARAKMFSPEEEDAELAKIPHGGALGVRLSSVTIDTANPKLLTYVIGNSAGEVLERKQGTPAIPSAEGEFLWVGFDYVTLPAFQDSLRVRVYHEAIGSLGDYIVHRGGQVERVQ